MSLLELILAGMAVGFGMKVGEHLLNSLASGVLGIMHAKNPASWPCPQCFRTGYLCCQACPHCSARMRAVEHQINSEESPPPTKRNE